MSPCNNLAELGSFMDAGVAKKLFFGIPDSDDASFGRGSASFPVYTTPSASYISASGKHSYRQQGGNVDVALFASAQQSLPVRYGIPEGQLYFAKR